jgi:hypothetical protein
MTNTKKLEFLNISWNLLTGASITAIVNFLHQNQKLKKLAMQHNRFGEYESFVAAKRNIRMAVEPTN